MWHFFIDLGKEGKKGLVSLPSIGSVEIISCYRPNIIFFLSFTFQHTFSFWEKFYFPKKKKLIRFDHLRHQLDQFSGENISWIYHRSSEIFFNIITAIFNSLPIATIHSIRATYNTIKACPPSQTLKCSSTIVLYIRLRSTDRPLRLQY